MKGIRRAAAVCLTMTLAVSTLFGNTAWADMPQDGEKKMCPCAYRGVLRRAG